MHVTIKCVATPGEGRVASAASVLQASEVADLAAIAKALPESWCVQVLPPHGQLAIGPISNRVRYHRCHVAARRWGRIARDVGTTH